MIQLLFLAINDPLVLSGMFLGGIFPFLVSAMTMTAVGDAAFDMIKEIRRQFKEIPGLLEGKAKPDTAKCVDIATQAALRKMILPGLLLFWLQLLLDFFWSKSFRRNVRWSFNLLCYDGFNDVKCRWCLG